ncbi:MAG: bifunctional pyr operon transcriptional regulator/uracil phosphoribosyltransferase PyrR [Polyangiaceae bacterium]|nr:bifunctional pyr operon transcriptional regulator/uracil phosphoribosyltransferase PyrR [Polyangiaceae bacterium]
MNKQILSTHEAALGLETIANNIVARVGNPSDVALVAIRRGGVPIALHIAELIQKNTQVTVPIGSVDIALYRDDTAVPRPNPVIGRPEVPFDVRTKKIVLVDDVLHTGRTVRAAMHALLEYGRSRAIFLAVLIDRGGRELPIQPDFCVIAVDTAPDHQIEVYAQDGGFCGVLVDS